MNASEQLRRKKYFPQKNIYYNNRIKEYEIKDKLWILRIRQNQYPATNNQKAKLNQFYTPQS